MISAYHQYAFQTARNCARLEDITFKVIDQRYGESCICARSLVKVHRGGLGFPQLPYFHYISTSVAWNADKDKDTFTGMNVSKNLMGIERTALPFIL